VTNTLGLVLATVGPVESTGYSLIFGGVLTLLRFRRLNTETARVRAEPMSDSELLDAKARVEEEGFRATGRLGHHIKYQEEAEYADRLLRFVWWLGFGLTAGGLILLLAGRLT
jgi:hypothetical protein